jgi:hypothetical protein
VAVVIVDRTRHGHRRSLIIGFGVLAGLLAVLLVMPGVTVLGLLQRVGLAQVGSGPGISIVAVAVAITTSLAVADGLRPSPRAVLAALAGASMAMTDIGTVARGLDRGDALRDLRLYLAAADDLLAGVSPYQSSVVTQPLGDQSLYPFLYPPPVLPLFAALSTLPWILGASAFIGAVVVAGAVSLRLLRVRWVWLPIFLLWPPFFEGVWAGNVAVPGLLFLAAAVSSRDWAAALAVGPLLKPQAVIPALWLLRERLWRQLLIGVAIAAGISLVTLPIVGIESWFDWLDGLRAFQQSQVALPALYGLALPQVVPYAAFLGIAAAVIGWALAARGRQGLRRLAIASVVASPSLYRHGLLALLPAMVVLPVEVVWLVLGSTVTFAGVWAAILITAIGTWVHDRSGIDLADEGVPSG